MIGLRHLHHRKKQLKEHPSLHSVLSTAKLDMLIYLAAVAGPLALLPQVLKLYSTHDAQGLALPTWIMLGCLNALWIVYGRKHRELPIVLTNTVLLVLNVAIAVGILLYA